MLWYLAGRAQGISTSRRRIRAAPKRIIAR
jgi:hypothetical protein